MSDYASFLIKKANSYSAEEWKLMNKYGSMSWDDISRLPLLEKRAAIGWKEAHDDFPPDFHQYRANQAAVQADVQRAAFQDSQLLQQYLYNQAALAANTRVSPRLSAIPQLPGQRR